MVDALSNALLPLVRMWWHSIATFQPLDGTQIEQVDLSQPEQIAALCQRRLAQEKVDILINAAGVLRMNYAQLLTLED